jgi:hypothetical protein
MPWKETGPMDERLRFIAAVSAGALGMSDACRLFGISRKSGYKWLERYKAGGAHEPIGSKACCARSEAGNLYGRCSSQWQIGHCRFSCDRWLLDIVSPWWLPRRRCWARASRIAFEFRRRTRLPEPPGGSPDELASGRRRSGAWSASTHSPLGPIAAPPLPCRCVAFLREPGCDAVGMTLSWRDARATRAAGVAFERRQQRVPVNNAHIARSKTSPNGDDRAHRAAAAAARCGASLPLLRGSEHRSAKIQ